MATIIHKNGLGLAPILFIVFLILKLTGTITWSWWWITAPLWTPLGLYMGIIVFLGFCAWCAILKKHV